MLLHSLKHVHDNVLEAIKLHASYCTKIILIDTVKGIEVEDREKDGQLIYINGQN